MLFSVYVRAADCFYCRKILESWMLLTYTFARLFRVNYKFLWLQSSKDSCIVILEDCSLEVLRNFLKAPFGRKVWNYNRTEVWRSSPRNALVMLALVTVRKVWRARVLCEHSIRVSTRSSFRGSILWIHCFWKRWNTDNLFPRVPRATIKRRSPNS